MKHLLTAIACFFALSMSAQTWNPDADFDNVIGVNDLMELLTVFGTEWTATYPQDPEFELAAITSENRNLVTVLPHVLIIMEDSLNVGIRAIPR